MSSSRNLLHPLKQSLAAITYSSSFPSLPRKFRNSKLSRASNFFSLLILKLCSSVLFSLITEIETYRIQFAVYAKYGLFTSLAKGSGSVVRSRFSGIQCNLSTHGVSFRKCCSSGKCIFFNFFYTALHLKWPNCLDNTSKSVAILMQISVLFSPYFVGFIPEFLEDVCRVYPMLPI